MNMLDMYEEDKDFKEYVDRFAAHYNEGRSITVLEALQMQIVNEYAEYLQKIGK